MMMERSLKILMIGGIAVLCASGGTVTMSEDC